MEFDKKFDKSKVYTALNATDIKVGSKGYFATTIDDLFIAVKNGYPLGKVESIRDDDYIARFVIRNEGSYDLFYLVEEPQEEKLEKFRPYKDTDEMIDHFCRHFELIPQVHCPPLIWIKAKGVPESKYLITRFSEYDKVTITFERNVYTTNLRLLSEDFTYLDGSPCGIEE